jgi:hypothetical protein
MGAWLTTSSHILSDIASRAYERAPQPLVAAYQHTAPLRQVYRDWRVPVKLSHGLIKDGRPASLLVAGAGPSIDYMLGRFFTQPLHDETVGHVRLADLMRTLRRLRASADMTIAQLPRLLSGWLGGGEYLHVPPWIGTRLLVPGHPEQYARRHKRIWNDLRPARHNELRPRLSHETAEFDRFYQDMYLPYATRRFGDHAAVRPLRQLRRLFHRGGTLMWIYQAEERIAAALLRQHDGCLDLLSLGLEGTGEDARRAGAIPAIYYFSLEHAKSQGCTLIDAGNCRPSPADGVTWFKRKWDVRLTLPTKAASDLLFRWERPNHAVRTFLSHTPLIIRQGRDLSLVAALNDGDVARVYQSLWMDGLQRLYVYREDTAIGSFMPGLSLVESTISRFSSGLVSLSSRGRA